MEKIPAAAGWQWIEQGFAIFRKQPAELTMLFFCYFFAIIAISIIPVIGTALTVLMPVLSLALLQGCANVEEGKRVFPNLLLTGFRSPAFGTLIMLGVLHAATLVLAFGATSLFDGGVLWKMMTGAIPANMEVLQKSGSLAATLAFLAVSLPCTMALWFTTPLAAWHRMSVGKSMFYSFFAVLKVRAAFLVYILTWWALMALLVILLNALASAMGDFVGGVATMSALSMAAVVGFCSFYCSYAAIFRKPDDDAPAQLPAPHEDGGAS